MKETALQFLSYLMLLLKKWRIWISFALTLLAALVAVAVLPNANLSPPVYWGLACLCLLLASFDVYRDLTAQKTPTLLQRAIAALDSPDFPERAYGIQTLAQMQDLAAQDALAGIAHNHDIPATRLQAAHALAARGDPRAVPTLIEALRSTSVNAREDSAASLGQLGAAAAAAVPDLGRLLLDHQVLSVCQKAAWALGEIGNPAAVQYLGDVLNDTTQPCQLRQQSTQLLGKIGGHDATSALGTALLKERDSRVCQAIVHALNTVSTPQAEAAIAAFQRAQGIRGKHAV